MAEGKPKGRKPDYWLKCMDKSRPGKSMTAKVGAAWANPDGSISIDLNHFVILMGNPDTVLTLFPVTRGETVAS